jgi:hypothetical protein
MTRDEILDFYRQPGPMTSAGEHADVFDTLPETVEDLAAVVQGIVLHEHWAQAYGEQLSSEQCEQPHLRTTVAMLNQVFSIDARPLTVQRPPGLRAIGNCRSYSVLMVAFLRSKGIPARARCGFGAYFKSGWFEDHWVCEHWDAAEQRWRLVDAQIDGLQRERLALDFDVLDVPRDRFIVAGEAWIGCRSSAVDPDRFGIADMRGLWFVGGNLVRDLAALNNMEMLPWDDWEGTPDPDSPIPDDLLDLYNRIAAVTGDLDPDFQALRDLYSEERLRVPTLVFNALRGQSESI